MKIQKSELHTILNKLKPVSLKDDLLVENFLGQLIFSKEGIAIFNDQTYMTYPVRTGLECVISFTKLFNFITKTTGKYIKIDINGDKVNVICGKAKLSLNSLLLNEIDLETITEIKNSLGDEDFYKLPERFTEGISACAFSASKDPSDGALSCVCIRNEIIMAADKTRVSLYEMEYPLLRTKGTILISADLSATLTKFQPTEFRVSKTWVIFLDENECLFAMRRISGKYKFNAINNLISEFEAGEKIKLPEEFNRTLDLITTMVNETTYQDRFMHIKLEDNKLILSSLSESAEIEEKIDVKYLGTPIFISINPTALQDALKIIGDAVLIKEKNDKMVLLKSDNYKHLIMLRLK